MSAVRKTLARRKTLLAVLAAGGAVAALVPRALSAIRSRSATTEAEFFESTGMARAGPPVEDAPE